MKYLKGHSENAQSEVYAVTTTPAVSQSARYCCNTCHNFDGTQLRLMHDRLRSAHTCH